MNKQQYLTDIIIAHQLLEAEKKELFMGLWLKSNDLTLHCDYMSNAGFVPSSTKPAYFQSVKYYYGCRVDKILYSYNNVERVFIYRFGMNRFELHLFIKRMVKDLTNKNYSVGLHFR
jgi:hypothetical protein